MRGRFVHFNRRLVAAMVVAAIVSGCVTAQHALRREDVAALKLTGVTVSYAKDATILWDDAVRAYGSAKAIPDHELATAATSAEARAFMQNFLAARIKTTLERQLSPKMAGTRPVRLEIVVKHFNTASAVQRIVIGGGHGMTADAILVDARTGATIASHPGLVVFVGAGQGVLGVAMQAALDAGQGLQPADRVLNSYADNYSIWLLKNS
jgi:hypothetical protein